MYPGHSNPPSSSPTRISFPSPQLSASSPPFPFSFLLDVLSPVNAACMRINVGHPLEHGQLPRDSSPKESWLSLSSSSQLTRAAQLGWAMSFLSRLCWEVDRLQFYLLQTVSVVMSSWGHEYKGPVDWALNPIKKMFGFPYNAHVFMPPVAVSCQAGYRWKRSQLGEIVDEFLAKQTTSYLSVLWVYLANREAPMLTPAPFSHVPF